MSTETISIPFSLTRRPRPARRAVAWLVPAADPAAWIEEICRWGVPMRGIRVYVLPRSRTTRAPLGALITVWERTPRTSPEALPYGLVGRRLYVPAEGDLYPAVSRTELDDMLPEGLAIFHPSIGLVGFSEGDALSVAALLDVPWAGAGRAPDRDAWGTARPGVTLPGRIRSLSAAALPSVNEVIDVGREDIGSSSPEELPELHSEPKANIVGDVGRSVGYGVVKGVHFALDHLARGLDRIAGAAGAGAGEGAPGPLDKLMEWTGAMSASLRARIEWARHREITRLLDLMKRDVDEGLRYALPLGGAEGAHRGIAPPSFRLGRRLVDFSLGALAGGRAADFWDIPWHFREQLRQSYFEAARRELALGRHRRAAYIYAQLLGDEHAAADALRQGRHYREAAVLYRDRLKKSLLAAECLEEGGLLKEAIEIYEEKQRFEKVAELHAALGDEEASARAYRRAAEASLEQGDRVRAARIHETKLGEPRQALAILSAGWPYSSQPGPCLKEQFALMGREGWHDGASRAVDVFKGLSLKPDLLGVLASALVRVVNSYPDPTVRRHAADAVRVAVAERLSHANADEMGRLTRCIAQLDPDDRLLERDARRYLTGKREAVQKADRAKRPRGNGPAEPVSRKEVRLCREYKLPIGYYWRCFAASRRGLYAAGSSSTSTPGFAVWCHDWMDHDGIVRWDRHATVRAMIVGRARRRYVLLVTSEREGLPLKKLYCGGEPRETAGPLDLIIPGCHACAGSKTGALLALISTSTGLAFTSCDLSGRTPACEALDLTPDEDDLAQVRSVALDSDFWFSLGRRLHGYTQQGGLHTIELDGKVLSLCASPIGASPRVVVTTGEGGRVIWSGSRLGEEERFAQDMADPLVGFTSDGFMIALSKEEGRVYQSQDRQLRARLSFEALDKQPLDVLPTERAGEFAVPTAEGVVKVYGLPAL